MLQEVFLKNTPLPDKIVYLLNYAITAPSAFNSQPWKFIIKGDNLHFLPDFTRWLKVSDAQQRQLYLSLGCALENLVIAASNFGLKTQIEGQPDQLVLSFQERASQGDPLFAAMSHRRTYYGFFQNKRISPQHRRMIQELVQAPLFLQASQDKALLRTIERYCLKTDIVQYGSSLYRQEISQLFEEGLLDGNILIEKLGSLVSSFQEDNPIPLKGATYFGCLMSQESHPKIWIETGRVFERIYLTCSHLGLKIKPINSTIVEPQWKEELQSLLSSGDQIPLQPFIIGYGSEEVVMNKKRRSVEEMLTRVF